MGIPAVINRAKMVLHHLRTSGFNDDAREFSRVMADLDRPEKVEAALAQLIEYCHIKWLGDVNVQVVSPIEWSRILDQLRTACCRELKRRRNQASQTRSPGNAIG